MASKIVKFVQKKKLDMKFSSAGEGHRLDEEKKPVQPPKVVVPKQPQKPQSSAAVVAGVAALERQQSGGGGRPTRPKVGVSSDSASVRSITDKFSGAGFRLNESEQSVYNAPRPAVPSSDLQDVREVIVASPFSVRVLMSCPVCDTSVAHSSVSTHIHQCLQEEYSKEPITASVHMIHTLASSEEESAICTTTIVRYIDNVLSHPGEEKYRKIRANNKAFKERVASVTGGLLFLKAIGFAEEYCGDDKELFHVLPEVTASCTSDLLAWKEVLTSAEKLVPQLNRNPQLLIPTGTSEHINLPKDFYNLSVEEIKKEQKLRYEAAEQSSVLRTKAMREKDDLKSAIKYYKFILIRIRFPEDVILQGVFRPMEPLSVVRGFISNCLLDSSREYKLSFMRSQLTDDMSRLAQLGLAPAAVLCLQWEGGEDILGFPVEQIIKPAVYSTLKQ